MMANYVRETDEELRQRSNRTDHRILASRLPAVRRRYGYVPSPTEENGLRRHLPLRALQIFASDVGRKRETNHIPHHVKFIDEKRAALA